ncbi:MAG: glycosyltransferase [Acidobacteria bacterium]|nr:glycosyltransferase [Acidobacteriota bacterium]
MRLAYFSPLPPSKSGIADYSAELLPALARGADLSVFVEKPDELRVNKNSQPYQVFDATHFDELHGQQPFDLCLYHQGNNPHHEYIYERALATPGLLVLHEHCLHHLIAWKTLGRKDEAGYWNEMFYAYGRRGARVAVARENDAASEYQQFLLPMNRRVVSRSLGIVVHNEYAAAQLEFAPGQALPVKIIPHHLSPRVYELDQLDKLECRRAFGLPEDAWIIASFGFVTQSKRIPTLLKAFKRLQAVVPNAMCLIVGEDHWKWSAAPLIAEMGLQRHVRLTGYTVERDFFRYLKAVDVVVNLRYPTAGETSGTLIRALGAGKPVIVSDHGQFGDLPDDVCLKVTAGPEEERELAARLRALACRPNLREGLGERASAWIRENNEVQRSAARYLQFAEQLIEGRKRGKARQPQPVEYKLDFKEAATIKFEHAEALDYLRNFFTDDPNASDYIRVHARRLLRTVELVPKGSASQRALELSSYLHLPLLLRHYGGYGELAVTNWWKGETREQQQTVRHAETGETLSLPMHNVNVERDRLPFPDNHFDVALCCELIEHLQEDPVHMLAELHRVVKWGGLVIVTTPNIASAFSVREALAGRTPNIYSLYNRQSVGDRHAREYTPGDVQAALEAAGFKAVRLFTENVWHETEEDFLRWLDATTEVQRELRGDNIYAVGRKQSAQIERFPENLYD